MRKYIFALTAALGLMMSGDVNAADIYRGAQPTQVAVYPTAPAPEIKWTGLHLGVGLGYGSAQNDIHADFEGQNVFSLEGLGGMGAVYDAEIGYDVRIPGVNFLVGALAGYGGSEVETSASLLGANASYKHGTSWWVGGRAGPVIADDRLLIYGKLVYVENNPDDLKFTGGSFSLDDRQGIGYGGGIEGALGDGLFATVEAMYYDYDDNTLFSGDGFSVGEDTDVLEVKARIRYKFGGSLLK